MRKARWMEQSYECPECEGQAWVDAYTGPRVFHRQEVALCTGCGGQFTIEWDGDLDGEGGMTGWSTLHPFIGPVFGPDLGTLKIDLLSYSGEESGT